MKFDSDADAAYITFRVVPWDHMDILDDYRNIDHAPDGEPGGVELLYVSKGVNLDGLPMSNVIARLLETEHIKIFA
ncbi:MAG: DUF2283 domain-containing protein, partial [Chloroflexota bacterium]|nr:DUF2283 domain-containing protein [Chloroflexota bacterium]